MDDLNDALAALPHGPSFRFIDSLIALTPGVSGSGRYRIRGDEAFLEGHFPGQPIMPGVLLIEAIAQLGGVVAQSDRDRQPLADLRLAAVRSAKILGAATPGDELEIQAQVGGRLGALLEIEGEVTLEGTLLAKARVTLAGTEII